jgi:heptaprenyl diphosphate synthase
MDRPGRKVLLVNIPELLHLPQLTEDLEEVDRALRRAVGSSDPFLDEVAVHLIAAGGKRIRPVLTVAASAAGGGRVTGDVTQGAVSVELVHIGSLYHDDVMDNAETRRGVESVNARWGNLVAIVAGDFLLARASEIAASLGTEVAGLLAATIGRLCEGQVGEVQSAFNPGRTESSYLAAISGKTASLMAAACRIGALTSGLPREAVDAVTAFGNGFGMAFQIRDDVLDFVSTEAELGKPAGHDLMEGVYTLPVIRALHDDTAGGELRALLGGPIDEPARDKAVEIVRSCGALEASLAVARRYADDAATAIGSLPGDTSSALAAFTHTLLDDIQLA